MCESLSLLLTHSSLHDCKTCAKENLIFATALGAFFQWRLSGGGRSQARFFAGFPSLPHISRGKGSAIHEKGKDGRRGGETGSEHIPTHTYAEWQDGARGRREKGGLAGGRGLFLSRGEKFHLNGRKEEEKEGGGGEKRHPFFPLLLSTDCAMQTLLQGRKSPYSFPPLEGERGRRIQGAKEKGRNAFWFSSDFFPNRKQPRQRRNAG